MITSLGDTLLFSCLVYKNAHYETADSGILVSILKSDYF